MTAFLLALRSVYIPDYPTRDGALACIGISFSILVWNLCSGDEMAKIGGQMANIGGQNGQYLRPKWPILGPKWPILGPNGQYQGCNE